MKIEDLGEDGLIEKIRLAAGTGGAGVITGIGDDAAVIKKTGGGLLLAAMDMLVENVHFTRKMSFFDIGHKAMGANLSDIAAMGGSPEYAFTSIGIRNGAAAKDIEALYEGVISLAREYGVSLLGGDTSRSPEAFIIDVCVLGEAREEHLCLRSGAKPGDLIFVTGTLGNAALALKKGEYFPVTPRIKEAGVIISLAKPSAMLDISDGLAKDLKRLCGSSRTGAKIFPWKIPAAAGASLEEAVSGGEDFELLFAAPGAGAEKLLSGFPEKTGVKLSCIGEILPESEGIFFMEKTGRGKPLEGGYEHF